MSTSACAGVSTDRLQQIETQYQVVIGLVRQLYADLGVDPMVDEPTTIAVNGHRLLVLPFPNSILQPSSSGRG